MKTQTTNLLIVLACMLANCVHAHAESAIELLGGFDESRIEASYPPGNSKTFSELAKMVYRINRVQRDSIRNRISDADPMTIGHPLTINGTIKSARLLRVPKELVDVLEFEVIQDTVVELESKDASTVTINVISTRLPKGATIGDTIEATGIVIENPSQTEWPTAIVAGKLKWFPKKPPSNGWRLLSEAGVDVSELARVATRNRQPLMAEDNDAFYQVLSAAHDVSTMPLAAELDAKWIQPVNLLQSPKDFSGDWLRMRLRTVRVTLIQVTDAKQQEQLGADHYYQVDATGSLDNVVIKIQRPPGEPGPPVTFEGTYPVSLVVKELPRFLRDAIRNQEGGDAVVSMISVPVQVDGFFFRLWSYSSDKMEREGAGDQFGPLLMVAGMTDLRTTEEEGPGVEIIGYLAAIGIVSGLLAALVWTRRNADEDQDVRERRQAREAEQLSLPENI